MITKGINTYIGIVSERFEPNIKVGKFCSIGSGLIAFGYGSEHPWVFNHKAVANYPFFEKGWGEYIHCSSKGDIVIGNDVWIGEDVTLLSGVKVGDGAIVGYGSVVAKDIPSYAVAVGNPARVIKYRFTPEQIERLLQVKWWDLPISKIMELLPLMTDVDKFLVEVERR